MLYKKFLILAFFLSIGYIGNAQTPFDSTLISNQRLKLQKTYQDLMRHVTSIEILNEKKDISGEGVIAAPRENLGGEATFIYEVSDKGTSINVYMTEFWYYSKVGENIAVRDYIVFVDQDQLGFDHDRIQKHKLPFISTELIEYLFDYVKKHKNSKFLSHVRKT